MWRAEDGEGCAECQFSQRVIHGRLFLTIIFAVKLSALACIVKCVEIFCPNDRVGSFNYRCVKIGWILGMPVFGGAWRRGFFWGFGESVFIFLCALISIMMRAQYAAFPGCMNVLVKMEHTISAKTTIFLAGVVILLL